ncbi:MAG: succinylglutamate desuccinylase [Marinobacterium sp.]|nr:succinylglutamate desuccinylase [Marinobacterium sp.]
MSRFTDSDFLRYTLDNPTGISEPSQRQLADGSLLTVSASGIMTVEPANPTRALDLVLSCGVHGNETAPMELVRDMVTDLLDGTLIPGVRLLVLIGNPVAANISQRFEQVNMNRLFSGNHMNHDCWEARRAAELEAAVSTFFSQGGEGRERCHYDLHTAIRGSEYEKFAVHPYTAGAPYHAEQLGFLAACGINAVLFSSKPSTTFSYASSNLHGAHAFTLELGKVYPFGQNDLGRFALINQALRQLIVTGTFQQATWQQQLICFDVCHELLKESDDFRLTIADDVNNFATFHQGDQVSTSSAGDYHAQHNGEAIVFPNANVPIGGRAALMLSVIDPAQIPIQHN